MSSYKDTIEDLKRIRNKIIDNKDNINMFNEIYTELLPYINDEGYKHIIYNLIKYIMIDDNNSIISKILFLKLLASGEYITEDIKITVNNVINGCDKIYESFKDKSTLCLNGKGTTLKEYETGDIISVIDSETNETLLTFEINYVSQLASTIINNKKDTLFYNLPFILHFDETKIADIIGNFKNDPKIKISLCEDIEDIKEEETYLIDLLFGDEFKISDDIRGYKLNKILELLIYSSLRNKYKDLIKGLSFDDKIYRLYNIIEDYDINIDIFKDILKFLFDDDNIINIIEKSASEDKKYYNNINNIYYYLIFHLLNNRYIEKYKTDKHKEFILYIIDVFNNKVNVLDFCIWYYYDYIININLYYEIVNNIINNKLNINLIPNFIPHICASANKYTYKGIKALNKVLNLFDKNHIQAFTNFKCSKTELINSIIKNYVFNDCSTLEGIKYIINDLTKNNRLKEREYNNKFMCDERLINKTEVYNFLKEKGFKCSSYLSTYNKKLINKIKYKEQTHKREIEELEKRINELNEKNKQLQEKYKLTEAKIKKQKEDDKYKFSFVDICCAIKINHIKNIPSWSGDSIASVDRTYNIIIDNIIYTLKNHGLSILSSDYNEFYSFSPLYIDLSYLLSKNKWLSVETFKNKGYNVQTDKYCYHVSGYHKEDKIIITGPNTFKRFFKDFCKDKITEEQINNYLLSFNNLDTIVYHTKYGEYQRFKDILIKKILEYA